MTHSEKLAQLMRYWILKSTTAAGSGHPTSSMSAADLMSVLFFEGFFKYDIKHPKYINNDRLIFSKGHASPLFYALWAATGALEEKELMGLRTFESRLEGHPTPDFPFADIASGSLGQGLSTGCGFALNGKIDDVPYKTYVLLGDSELAEGSNWEACECASFYKLNNLVAIVDVNRLGQTGETMHGWDVASYENKFLAFGFATLIIDGHDYDQIKNAYKIAQNSQKPMAIIAKTIKGKGVNFLENKIGWHGKALNEEQLTDALSDLGDVDTEIRGTLTLPETIKKDRHEVLPFAFSDYQMDEKIPTRKAYGSALLQLGKSNPYVIALDGETQDSTFSSILEESYPDKFLQMFIMEQNMASVAAGLSKRGKVPFASTFSAFWPRAHDQIRMNEFSQTNIKYVGSHGGVSIGQDGPSQMGLEDLCLFSTLLNSVVLYPADAVSCDHLVYEASQHVGNVYLRTTRMATPVIYKKDTHFPIGGSHTLFKSSNDKAVVVAAGVTLHEAIKAYHELQKEGIHIRVIDAYSIKPIDQETLLRAYEETYAVITVEDHYSVGGLGDAVLSALAQGKTKKPIYKLAVYKTPRSGKPEELLNFEEISSSAIVAQVKKI